MATEMQMIVRTEVGGSERRFSCGFVVEGEVRAELQK